MDGPPRVHPFIALQTGGDVHHHDPVFLDDADQQNDADQRDHRERRAEHEQRERRAIPADGKVDRMVSGWIVFS